MDASNTQAAPDLSAVTARSYETKCLIRLAIKGAVALDDSSMPRAKLDDLGDLINALG